jgi:hypothetical protein
MIEKNQGLTKVDFPRHGTKIAYGKLWDSINKENQWVSNPWVWVYSFRKVSHEK